MTDVVVSIPSILQNGCVPIYKLEKVGTPHVALCWLKSNMMKNIHVELKTGCVHLLLFEPMTGCQQRQVSPSKNVASVAPPSAKDCPREVVTGEEGRVLYVSGACLCMGFFSKKKALQEP